MKTTDIDFDKNYGVSFKFTFTPNKTESISLVTPENSTAWTEWQAVPEPVKEKFKDLWQSGKLSIAKYKMDQIKKYVI